jgi:hypothetical protein
MKIFFLNLPTPIIISPKKAGLKQSLPFFDRVPASVIYFFTTELL